MKKVRATIWLMTIVLSVLVMDSSVFALSLNDGGTWDITWEMEGFIIVDEDAPGMRTTVNLLEGGSLSAWITGFNDSRINIDGGSVGTGLTAVDNCQVTISDGSIGSTTSINGNSELTMSGGSVFYLVTHEDGQVTISDGIINWYLELYDNSRVTMSGGSVSHFNIWNNSQVTISGGSLGDLLVGNTSNVTMSGGNIAGDIAIDNQTTLTLNGSNFTIDGNPFGYGELTSIIGGGYGYEPYRQLTGILANGDIINNPFRIGETATIVLAPVPEPTTLLFLGLGGLVLRRRK